jgi:AraC-like DNA-binding protein
MAQARRPLLILHPNGAFREAVQRMERRGFRCTVVRDWSVLRAEVRTAPPAALVVVDPYFGASAGGAKLAPELRSLLWEFPSCTVLAALRVQPGLSRDLRAMGGWGVSDIVSIDEECGAEALHRRLRTAESRPLRLLLTRTLPSILSGRARSILVTAAEVVASGGRGRELARRLHLSERSVLRWCDRAGLPVPRRLTAWMRILLAASLLDDPGRSVLGVARACGYASDGSLRRAMHDFLGLAPTVLRRDGAFRTTAERFLAEMAKTREAARARSRPRTGAAGPEASRAAGVSLPPASSRSG